MKKTEFIEKKLLELDDDGFTEVIGASVDRLANIEEPKDGIVHITDIEEEIKELYKNWGKMSGLSTGYSTLDKKIGGMDKGHVVLIGGETSNGKSALAANITRNVALNHSVLFVTLEMLREELGQRLLHINNGRVDNLDITFQAEHRIDYKDLEPIIKNAKKTAEIEMVVLDYMQYLGRGMTNQEVAKMSKEFKSLALKYQIPFVVIVSLRKSEGGQRKRKWTQIEIEEFMGTGAIGYDCDTAMITSRKNQEDEFTEDKIFVKVLKTRNSRLDYNDRIVELNWDETRISEDWVEPIQKRLDNKQFNEV